MQKPNAEKTAIVKKLVSDFEQALCKYSFSPIPIKKLQIQEDFATFRLNARKFTIEFQQYTLCAHHRF